MHYSKINIRFPVEWKKTSQVPSSTFHLEGWTWYLSQTQLNSLKPKWIQRQLNPTSALWKDLMLCRLN